MVDKCNCISPIAKLHAPSFDGEFHSVDGAARKLCDWMQNVRMLILDPAGCKAEKRRECGETKHRKAGYLYTSDSH